MSAKLLTEYKMAIKELKLIPGKGGCFELVADGELLYSKLATNKFPDETEIVQVVGKRVR